MFSSIDDALGALKAGGMIIVVDDEQRENEGDLVMAAESMTSEQMAFMIRHTGGVVCVALANTIADRLNLPPMVERNTSRRETPYTISVDAVETSTGISAEDRTKTVVALVSEETRPEDLARPGHVFPLRAQSGGVLWRAGHTEASVDMCRIAGLKEGAAISELMHDDGTMMRLPALFEFAKQHQLPTISIADLIAYRYKTERFIRRGAETQLQTKAGEWRLIVYKDLLHNIDHIALVKNISPGDTPTLVRVHSECLTGDALGSLQCDCGEQLTQAMTMIQECGQGALVYMKQHEGRGIGLENKIKAYELQRTKGFDTVEANQALGFQEDLREYGVGAQILVDLGIKKVRLMTNNPKKMGGIGGYGLEIIEQVPIEVTPNGINTNYLRTKKQKMNHRLSNV
ncbi:MAG: bifunctional 3,4-dihydroxy-2-butanone 4-phosphate synthase/GTP cyclohydrolase II [Candidatus Magasanikbacteria bacterium RIFCSPHIGHO2_02_FULL_47_14]|uniref:Riboflavin biosynthesis protein RibBA n=1 Tax=Candidatus Magasanikbacteria bacterium RIFCSPHIGHO2_02_FULL_47_14 TaxID=1798680 RepID=A0A1F6M0Z0_9BACT|nr:MAG: bifunctional 3,4-dihydroxy-2-butanone 4-phosphate synthase/GTP cyclohydrolase II [Candidatus Magasanikbacteria bacterium RIFCSPHIGHO2_02_FULL_47_14]